MSRPSKSPSSIERLRDVVDLERLGVNHHHSPVNHPPIGKTNVVWRLRMKSLARCWMPRGVAPSTMRDRLVAERISANGQHDRAP